MDRRERSCYSAYWIRKNSNNSGTSSVQWRRVLIFFFSSRRRHTRLQGDWSSDVCSSDLKADVPADFTILRESTSSFDGDWSPLKGKTSLFVWAQPASRITPNIAAAKARRSEERRVGKECRSRWSPYH